MMPNEAGRVGKFSFAAEQTDRDAAARHVENGLGMADVARRIRRGDHDDHEVVQTYAAHRIAEQERCARLIKEHFMGVTGQIGWPDINRAIATIKASPQ